MKTNHTSNAKRNVIGLILVILGLLLLLNNFKILNPKVGDIFLSWPMVLVAIGIVSLVGKNYSSAFIFIFIGCFFLAPRIFDIDIKYRQLLWPLIIIFSGLAILFQQWSSKYKNIGNNKIYSDFIDEFNIFSSKHHSHNSQIFKGGRISCVLAGTTVDFSGAELYDITTILHITSFIGSVKLLIPSNWMIKNDLTNVLGGISLQNKASISYADDKKLVITGSAVLGSIEIVYV